MDKLGVDPLVIGFQIFNFGLLVFVLNKFLYKPILKALKAKSQEFDEIAAKKEELAKKEEDLGSKGDAITRETQKEKLVILKEARLEAARIKKEAKDEAERKAKEMLQKVKKDFDADRKALSDDFEKEVLTSAYAIVEKVLDESGDKSKVDTAYKKLGKVKSTLWQN